MHRLSIRNIPRVMLCTYGKIEAIRKHPKVRLYLTCYSQSQVKVKVGMNITHYMIISAALKLFLWLDSGQCSLTISTQKTCNLSTKSGRVPTRKGVVKQKHVSLSGW